MEEGEWIVVKEPNGSVGAPYLAAAFPRSALVLLIRDPRDVAASALDRHRPGGGAYEWRKSEGSVRDRASRDPDAFIEGQAKRYMRNVGAAKRAYEAHEGPKVMVRYEDLRTETVGTMRRVYSTLRSRGRLADGAHQGLRSKAGGDLPRALPRNASVEDRSSHGPDQLL